MFTWGYKPRKGVCGPTLFQWPSMSRLGPHKGEALKHVRGSGLAECVGHPINRFFDQQGDFTCNSNTTSESM
jgi:hypothetical protein